MIRCSRLIVITSLLIAHGAASLVAQPSSTARAASDSSNPSRNPNIAWELLTPTLKGRPGETVMLRVRARIADGHRLFSMKQYGPDELAPQPLEVLAGRERLTPGAVKASRDPIARYDPNFEIVTEAWESGEVTLSVPVKIPRSAPGTDTSGAVLVYFMTCNDDSCLPPNESTFAYAIEITGRGRRR